MSVSKNIEAMKAETAAHIMVGGWPGYHTHFTRLPRPPASLPQGEEAV